MVMVRRREFVAVGADLVWLAVTGTPASWPAVRG
jgi:hypothetical protein